MDEFFSANLKNWDERAGLHATDTTGSYRIAKVLAGGSSLHAIEAEEIGDLAGRDIVHLQCHIGLDTLSLKHLGAASVTGLDFSPKAIAAGRDFATRAGTEARFVEASLYDAVEALGATYDLAFVTWGRSTGCRTSTPGPKSSPRCCGRAENSICWKAIRC